MLLVTIMVLPIVYAGDVIHFDWDPIPVSHDNYYDRMDDAKDLIKLAPESDNLESEYGVFVDRPKFQTQRNKTLRDKIAGSSPTSRRYPKIRKVPSAVPEIESTCC
jgi:hypothetical protein